MSDNNVTPPAPNRNLANYFEGRTTPLTVREMLDYVALRLEQDLRESTEDATLTLDKVLIGVGQDATALEFKLVYKGFEFGQIISLT